MIDLRLLRCVAAFVAALLAGTASVSAAFAQAQWKAVDVPTRAGVTQRFLFASPEQPVASVILFSGSAGNLQLTTEGIIRSWADGNFLVRMREAFVRQQLAVAVIDAPSDRQSAPYLAGFRQKPEHVTDVKAVIAWLKQQNKLPVWLIGTSRGTQSAAYVTTQATPANGGPDGLVLTSTIMTDVLGGRPVPAMALADVTVPVLVVHHVDDGCSFCAFDTVPKMVEQFVHAPRKELIAITGGQSEGHPCEAYSHHGYRGQEQDVVERIGGWIRKTGNK